MMLGHCEPVGLARLAHCAQTEAGDVVVGSRGDGLCSVDLRSGRVAAAGGGVAAVTADGRAFLTPVRRPRVARLDAAIISSDNDSSRVERQPSSQFLDGRQAIGNRETVLVSTPRRASRPGVERQLSAQPLDGRRETRRSSHLERR